MFVTYLHNKQNNPRPIEVYLSGVRSGYLAPPTIPLYVKLAIKGLLERAKSPCQKLQLTYNILYRINYLMQSSYDNTLCVAVIDILLLPVSC